jgi:hypothetical protein
MFRIVAPPSGRGIDYASMRRRTLGFEVTGGERAAALEVAGSVRTPAAPTPAVTTRRYVVTGTNKERVMTRDKVRSADAGFEHERREEFTCDRPISAVIVTRSGDVTVRASTNGDVGVVVGTNRASGAEMLERAAIRFDSVRATLEIETAPRGSRGAKRVEWFSSGGDLDVIVTLPEGSDLQVTTASGDTLVDATLADVKVTSASGDVRATETLDEFDVRTASGDVTAGPVRTRLRCRVASGDVTAYAAASTEVASASGDVVLTSAGPGALSVNSASGDVTVHVASGVTVDVTGRSISGSLRSEIDLDGEGADASHGELSFIKVNTISGDILIDRARR